MFSQSLITIFTLTATISLTSDRVTATPAISIVRNEQNSIELSDRAKKLYLNQQYAEASQIWQQAATAFKVKKDILNQAMALSNLALTQQKLGNLIAAKKNITSSIELLKKRAINTERQRILASSLDIKGVIERSQGQSRSALTTWQQAESIYRALNNQQAIIKNQINQAQGLQDLGYYRRSSKVLQSVQNQLVNESNSSEKITALLSFGNTLRATGNLEQSLKILQQADQIAVELNATEQQDIILLSLGNTLTGL